MKAYTKTPKGQVTIPAKKNMLADFGFLREHRHSRGLEEIRKSVRKKIAEKALK